MQKENISLQTALNTCIRDQKILLWKVYEVKVKQSCESACSFEPVEAHQLQSSLVCQKSALLVGGSGQSLGLDQLWTLYGGLQEFHQWKMVPFQRLFSDLGPSRLANRQ